MESPDRDPVVVVDKSQGLSGPDPALAVLRGLCDQDMSHQWLAPSRVARKPVPHGHGLEIPMTLWGRDQR